ncbi:MAG: DNA primase catalytic subunit PriS [Thermoplasmata archaeon]|nr:DNA primase catalytic subunit PriS [Thermoplasmata archaeon]
MEKSATEDFLIRKFREYYKSTELYLPNEFTHREFGFMFFKGDYVQRHLGFKTRNEVKRFLLDRAPSHVYYSSAYYERPGAPTMDEKGWLGTDLIFDLDADHIPRVKGLSFERQLHEIKLELMSLVDDFLLDDFGFAEDDLLITFSGGRGYHVHVRSPRVRSLTSPERREIVDFIQGTGLEAESAFRKRAIHRTRYGSIFRLEMPKPDDGGWSSRVHKGLMDFVGRLEKMPKEEALEMLSEFEGIGEKTANEIHASLFDGVAGKRGVDRLREGRFDFFPRDSYRNHLVKVAVKHTLEKYHREIDEPVTADIRRLIRLPTSLHGKSGMRVIILERGEVDDFVPLRDAFPETFGSDPVGVVVEQDVAVTLKEEKINLHEGITDVPEFAAVFLMCRGLAKLSEKEERK